MKITATIVGKTIKPVFVFPKVTTDLYLFILLNGLI